MLKSPPLAESAKEPECPPGCVRREFTMAERQLVIFACSSYAGGGDYKKAKKLRDVRALFKADDVEKYFDDLREKEHDLGAEWTRETNIYRSYMGWKAGAMTAEKLSELFPTLDLKDLAKAPKRPPFNAPKLSKDEKRGPCAVLFIPAKMEVFIGEALKVMTWGSADCEDVADLAEKYRLEDE